MRVNKQTKRYLRQKIVGYVSKDQKTSNLSRYMRLDLGENLLKCSKKVPQGLKNITQADLMLYADPSGQKIKETLAGLYNLYPSNFIIANSSNELIDYLSKIIINSGDKVLVITPTFFRFIESSLSTGGKIIYVSLDEKNNYEFDNKLAKTIIKKIRQLDIKLVWLCNPNNPTGTTMNLEDIKTIIEKNRVPVILDEAFYEYYDLENKESGISLIKENENLIILRTLSKAYGLAGLRFGYAIAHQKTIKTIESCRNTLLMTSGLAQKLAISALKDQKWLKDSVKKTRILRKEVFNEIKKLKNYSISNSRSNVYLLKHKSKDVYKELKKRGILTADFRQEEGLVGKNYVRITVGNKKENDLLVSNLRKI